MSLPTCPREDCTFAGPHHDHYRSTGIARDRAEVPDCSHLENVSHTRCYAPRTPEDERIVAWHTISGHPLFRKCYDTEGPLLRSMLARLDGLADMTSLPTPQPAAVVLPTVEEVARTIMLDDGYPHREMDPAYLTNAQAVLDLIASRVRHWVPVEPGTVIKAGTRLREDWDDQIAEWTLGEDQDPYQNCGRRCRYYIDPATVPAEPEDPRIKRAHAIIPALQRVTTRWPLLPAALEAIDAIDALEADR